MQHDLVLGPVGVLVLVDEDVLEALLVVLEHVGMLVEQPHGDREQVVEVHGAGPLQPGLVLAVDVGDACARRSSTPSPRTPPDRTSSFFAALIVGVHAAGREPLRVEVRGRE